jgi:hypothetical protein
MSLINNPKIQKILVSLEKKPKLKKFLYYFYFGSLHILAAIAMFLILTALAVQFKWTNQNGSVDINSRYFSEMADKYNQGFKTDSLSIAKDEYIMFRNIGILAKYYPSNAKIIMKAYYKFNNIRVVLRMLDAINLKMKDNKEYQKELANIQINSDLKTLSIFPWSNCREWKQFSNAVKADKRAIDSVSKLTGVESRFIVMCLVGEQVRMFNSGREAFKKYVTPFNHLILPTNRGYGVTGILEHTALKIEKNLFDRNSDFYAGDYFRNVVNLNDSFPELVNDTIESHKHLTIQRLIKGGDHYYSYLYTAFFLRQFQAHWVKAGYTLENRPEILGTLFNLGYQKSKPKKNPEVGGSNFNVGGIEYTFGGICYEFYYSGELQDYFPLTGTGFVPVAELERKNKELIAQIKYKISKGDKEREKKKKEEEQKEKVLKKEEEKEEEKEEGNM